VIIVYCKWKERGREWAGPGKCRQQFEKDYPRTRAIHFEGLVRNSKRFSDFPLGERLLLLGVGRTSGAPNICVLEANHD
jgi:hypothetical protein